MAPKTKTPSLRTFSREFLKEGDQPALRQELFQGTDRSSALVGAAVVDSSLVLALGVRLIGPKDQILEYFFYDEHAPLSSFSSRIRLGRGLGIFGIRIEKMLNSIRNIRNAFAHSVRPLNFSDDIVVKECEKLRDTTLDKVITQAPEGLHTYRERYVAVCLNLQVLLNDSAKRHLGKMVNLDIPD